MCRTPLRLFALTWKSFAFSATFLKCLKQPFESYISCIKIYYPLHSIFDRIEGYTVMIYIFVCNGSYVAWIISVNNFCFFHLYLGNYITGNIF